MSYTLTAGAHTDVGMKRDHNEDYYYRSDLDKAVEKNDGYLFIAADGVGGNRGGGDASRVACEQLPKHFFNPERKNLPLTQRLTDAINLTHHDIRTVAATNPLIGEMSCTIVILAAASDEVITAHLGDARIYQLSDGELTQITKDHSWVQEQVDAGYLTPEQAAVHRNRNVVTRTLGGSHMHQPEVSTVSVKPDDRFLLCSDGLHGPVSHAILTTLSQQDEKLDDIAKVMVDHANKNGGPDNIVAILVQVGEQVDQVIGSDEITRPAKTIKLSPTPTQPILAVPPQIPSDIEETKKQPAIIVEPPQQAQAAPTAQEEETGPPVNLPAPAVRMGNNGAFYGVITVLFLAVSGLLAWLILSGDRLASNDPDPIASVPTEIAVIVTIPTSVNNPNDTVVAPTSTLAPERTLTATLLPTNTPAGTPTANSSTAEAIALSLTEVVSATQISNVTTSPTIIFETPTPKPPKLELLDIRCDSQHIFEPNAFINFKWYGKESSTLVDGEWMQIAIQSATQPEGVARQITDRGANILPEPANGEWLVPRKLSSFGIVGEGDLNWWVEYVVNDTIVDSSDTGCFSIVPKSEQPPANNSDSATPAPDVNLGGEPNSEGSNRSDE
ncbi:MAG: PP2C family serine/threonine-protein phosphatase [Anaerolineae bacterium]